MLDGRVVSAVMKAAAVGGMNVWNEATHWDCHVLLLGMPVCGHTLDGGKR